MGIDQLSKFLKKREVYETLNISTLKYTKLGIDAPMFLYKFKGVTDPNTNEWLGCFVSFVTFLRKNDIHPIFVFEGKAPPEKAQTQADRREQKQKVMGKTDAMEQDLNEYIGSGTISPLLAETWEKIKAKGKNKSLLVKPTLVKSFISTDDIKEEINHRRRYEISIKREDIVSLKQLLKIMGVSYIQSNGEAETDCVSLFYDGVIDYIVSEDTDVLAYFPPLEFENAFKELKVIVNFNINEFTFTQISKQKVLETLNLTAESFRDFCIMCGTDYNKNIFRVGVERSYKFISDYYTIENVPLDTTILNHIRGRELFEVKKNPKILKKVKWCRLPSGSFIENLTTFVMTYNLRNIDVEHVFNALSQPDLEIFQDLRITEPDSE
jgi:5'-3' exonuclease